MKNAQAYLNRQIVRLPNEHMITLKMPQRIYCTIDVKMNALLCSNNFGQTMGFPKKTQNNHSNEYYVCYV